MLKRERERFYFILSIYELIIQRSCQTEKNRWFGIYLHFSASRLLINTIRPYLTKFTLYVHIVYYYVVARFIKCMFQSLFISLNMHFYVRTCPELVSSIQNRAHFVFYPVHWLFFRTVIGIQLEQWTARWNSFHIGVYWVSVNRVRTHFGLNRSGFWPAVRYSDQPVLYWV